MFDIFLSSTGNVSGVVLYVLKMFAENIACTWINVTNIGIIRSVGTQFPCALYTYKKISKSNPSFFVYINPILLHY